ncbi:hypothetical protein Peur_024099 [Populus x canadensis]
MASTDIFNCNSSVRYRYWKQAIFGRYWKQAIFGRGSNIHFKPSGTSSVSGASNNGIIKNSYSLNLITSTPNYMNFQNNINKQNRSILDSYSNTKSIDLRVCFLYKKNEQAVSKLAPLISTIRGRGGRGRGRGGTSILRSSHAKPQSEQPPLLDLL